VTRFDLSLFDRINLWRAQNRYPKRDTWLAESPCQKQPPLRLVPARIQINCGKLCKSHRANCQNNERESPQAGETSG